MKSHHVIVPLALMNAFVEIKPNYNDHPRETQADAKSWVEDW